MIHRPHICSTETANVEEDHSVMVVWHRDLLLEPKASKASVDHVPAGRFKPRRQPLPSQPGCKRAACKTAIPKEDTGSEYSDRTQSHVHSSTGLNDKAATKPGCLRLWTINIVLHSKFQ